ncbi:Mitogen-activated protein kinase kinase kinase 17 [Linum perenne]
MTSWTRGHKLGHGSTAAVYLATPHNSGEPFAVKSAELSQSEFLQREQRILSTISSPYIIKYRGWEITTEEDGKEIYNLKLEYMPGGEIRRRNGGRMDETTIGMYTWQVLKGLEYLHSKGIVHCDVKGSNILVGPDGAKLADFGCSKRVGSDDPTRGTPMFMAPEAARGEEQGCAGDVWGLGCAVIEMAAGGETGSGADPISDPVSAMYRVGYSSWVPEFPGGMSEQGRDFLEKCLRRDRKQRWTARQLLDHPFVSRFGVDSKCFDSPTSVLDGGYWNSVEEGENLGDFECGRGEFPSCCSSSEAEEEEEGRRRIGRLAIALVGPIWGDDEDDVDDCDRWIAVRGDLSEPLDSDDCVISDEIRGLISLEGCKYERFGVISCSRVKQDHDVLVSLPSLSRIVPQV